MSAACFFDTILLWEAVMDPWKTKTRSILLDQQPWLLVENHTVETRWTSDPRLAVDYHT